MSRTTSINALVIPFLSSTATFVLLMATALATQPDSTAKPSSARGSLRLHPTNSRYVGDNTKGANGSLRAVYPSTSATNVVRPRGNSFCESDGPFLGLGALCFQALHDTNYNRPRLELNLALNAGKAVALPQGPDAYIIKGSLTQVNSRFEWPDKAWAKVPPAEAGLDEARLSQARDYALTGGGSGYIIRGGKLVFSWGDQKQRYDLKSTTKSFGAAALGLAINDGKVRLSDKARAHHPTLGTPPDRNAETGWLDEITILHLASQTAGFDKPGGYVPLLFKPGSEWAYSDSGPNWLAECVTLAYRRDLDELMDERLFAPLGITRADLDWRKNAYRPELIDGLQRREFGAGISANVDAMARFGLLWLRGGEWNGARILPRDFVDKVRTTVSGVPGLKVRVPEDYGKAASHYGLLWWNNADETIKGLAPDTYWAWGLYDSLIVVMPTLDIVVARAGQSWKRAKDADHYEVLKPFLLPIVAAAGAKPMPHAKPLRIVIETDAGGDPDDEQSLVRFLVYANEFDIEGIIANRPVARDGENQNPVRDGLGIVRAQVKAYGECHANLMKHDPRFPTVDQLLSRTVAGYDDTDDGVRLILRVVDEDDLRPVWFSNWGTDKGSAVSCLKRALDRVLRERGPEGYAKFKSRLRLSSYDKFDEHTTTLEPLFPLWVDTFRPSIGNQRWYHRFSALTATAGGFDIQRDVRTGHGPLGALYPANTGLRQKEGDTMAFLYLVPTGMNDPNEPVWGSWGGRYGPNEEWPGRPYFWANQADTWRGTTSRDHTLARWAADVQNDFRARMDWCVANDFRKANHHPIAVLNHRPGSDILRLDTQVGGTVELNAAGSSDPDGNTLTCEWFIYGEAGTYRGEIFLSATNGLATRFIAPDVKKSETIHVILSVRDDGQPPLCSYRRAIVAIRP